MGATMRFGGGLQARPAGSSTTPAEARAIVEGPVATYTALADVTAQHAARVHAVADLLARLSSGTLGRPADAAELERALDELAASRRTVQSYERSAAQAEQKLRERLAGRGAGS